MQTNHDEDAPMIVDEHFVGLWGVMYRLGNVNLVVYEHEGGYYVRGRIRAYVDDVNDSSSQDRKLWFRMPGPLTRDEAIAFARNKVKDLAKGNGRDNITVAEETFELLREEGETVEQLGARMALLPGMHVSTEQATSGAERVH